MLPKVALQTSRAASAAVQHPTSFRNFLQIQSNGPSNSRGGNGPTGSSSGFRYNAGSRSYHSAGRAVSQAGLYEVNDGAVVQSDDTDDAVIVSRPTRTRRHSTSLTVADRREQRSEPLGVLQAVQIHARSRHAFAVDSPVKPRSRRNSISAGEAITVDSALPPPPPPPFASTHRPKSPSPVFSKSSPSKSEDTYVYQQLIKSKSLKATDAAAVVLDFRQSAASPTVAEFNAALDSLFHTRPAGEPLTLLLETYNDMISRGLVPNSRTYITLIMALTDRDMEVQWAIQNIKQRETWQKSGVETEGISRDAEQLKLFLKEDCATSALSLFRAMTTSHTARVNYPATIYRNLIRACSFRASEPGMVQAAIQVWTFMESVRDNISSGAFQWMISVYKNAGDLSGAQVVFQEFRKASGEGRVFRGDLAQAPRHQLGVFNEMIQTYFRLGQPHLAVSLVDEMLTAAAAQTPDNDRMEKENLYMAKFDVATAPAPSVDTFSTVILELIASKDIDTAWGWFQRLLKMPHSASGVDRQDPTLSPTRPHTRAWRAMIEGLAGAQGQLGRLNQLVTEHLPTLLEDKIDLRGIDVVHIFNANMTHLTSLGDKPPMDMVKPSIDVMSTLLDQFSYGLPHGGEKIWQWLVNNGYPTEAITFFDRVLRASNTLSPTRRSQLISLTTEAYTRYGDRLPLEVVLTLGKLAQSLRYTYPLDFTTFLLQIYSRQHKNTHALLDVDDWVTFLTAASCLEVMSPSVPTAFCPSFAFKGGLSLLHDISRRSNKTLSLVAKAAPEPMATLLIALARKDGEEAIRQELSDIGVPTLFDEVVPTRAESVSDKMSSVFDSDSNVNSAATSPILAEPTSSWRFASPAESNELSNKAGYNRACNPDDVYKDFCALAEQKKLPSFLVAAKIATLFSRSDRVSYVPHLDRLMDNMRPLPNRPAFREYLTFLDNLIPCYAMLGDLERAHLIRQIILEAGSAPSANSYGALVYHLKETTDDATNALALFNESKTRGVPSSAYLYNNIISKVAKARKADLALELFTSMKAERITTSSITYGAVIGACVRVGDASSAELLFAEMVEQHNFHARIPPYNTMIQLYTTTKPNKERALYFFEQLQKARIEPTSYTYKLLIDAHMLDPINIEKAEEVFSTVAATQRSKGDKAVTIEGQHVAAMLNAYGCVRKDLSAAMAFFDNASRYLKGGYDAVVFEAIFNVLTVHRRPDLITAYLEKMQQSKLHMTAYVANVIIRAYSVANDIEQAREIFESLHDPPKGHAALYNHAPHGPSVVQRIAANAPSYREPSTWEAMVRAELGHGHRDRALQLLERLKEREYPEAVFNRISGVLVDHSSLPP